MGRGVEEGLINHIKSEGKKKKIQKIVFRYLKTKKNKPMLDFLKQSKALNMLKMNTFEIKTS